MTPFAAMLLAGAAGAPPAPPAVYTWDPAATHANLTLSAGNLIVAKGSFDALKTTRGTYGIADTSNGYFEIEVLDGGSSPFMVVGVGTSSVDLADFVGGNASGWGYYQQTGEKYNNNTPTSYGATWTTGDIIQVAYKNGKVWFGKNNTWQGGGDPAAGTGEAYSGITGTIYPFASLYRQSSPSHVLRARFRASQFTYAPPSGFGAWAPVSAGSGWSTTDKASTVVISGNANQIASIVSTGSEVGNVRGTQSRNASENRAFEIITIYNDGGGSWRGMPGIGTSIAELLNYPGYDSAGFGIWANSGNLYHNTTSGSGTSLTSPLESNLTVLTFHLNAGVLKVAHNGGTQVTIATGLTGDWYPMWGPGSAAAGTRRGILFTTGLIYLPSGASEWG